MSHIFIGISFQIICRKGRICTLFYYEALLITTVAEKFLNLSVKSREDRAIEKKIKTCKDNAADYYTDDDLNSGIDISFTGCGLNCRLCGNYRAVEFVLDCIDKFLHLFFPFQK